MADIAAKDVAALRKETGAGMMDCKQALQDADGDMEAARKALREKGLTKADKRAGREARDGTVEVVVEGTVGVVVEVNCETDFVAKGDELGGFAADLAQHVLEHGDEDVASQRFGTTTVEEAVKELAGKVGENVSLGRAVRMDASDGIIDGYKHLQNDRGVIGVLVAMRGVAADDATARQVAHDVALHVASSAPRWLGRDEVPDDAVVAEREVLENLTRNEGKPEEAIPKIVDGRMNAFYKENVLLEQPFVRDPKRTVGALLDDLPGAELSGFARVRVGED